MKLSNAGSEGYLWRKKFFYMGGVEKTLLKRLYERLSKDYMKDDAKHLVSSSDLNVVKLMRIIKYRENTK